METRKRYATNIQNFHSNFINARLKHDACLFFIFLLIHTFKMQFTHDRFFFLFATLFVFHNHDPIMHFYAGMLIGVHSLLNVLYLALLSDQTMTGA